MLTKHDERKMPKNRGHIESLARAFTETAIKTLAGIMMEQTSPPMARIMAAKVLLDRGRGKPKEMHHSEVDDKQDAAQGRQRDRACARDPRADRVERPNPTVRDQPEQKWRQYSLTAFSPSAPPIFDPLLAPAPDRPRVPAP